MLGGFSAGAERRVRGRGERRGLVGRDAAIQSRYCRSGVLKVVEWVTWDEGREQGAECGRAEDLFDLFRSRVAP